MPEDGPKEAGFLEKIAVNALLWWEKKLEKKPPTLEELEKRIIFERRLRIASTSVLSAVFIGFLVLLLRDKYQETQTSPYHISSENPDLAWLNKSQALGEIAQARRNTSLELLTPSPSFPDIKMVRDIAFQQTTTGVVLAVDQSALDLWLKQLNLSPNKLSFSFIDSPQRPNFVDMEGFNNIVIHVDERFKGIPVYGTNVNDNMLKVSKPAVNNLLKQILGSDLSSRLVLTFEYIQKYGIIEAFQRISSESGSPYYQEREQRRQQYQTQFMAGRSRPPIKIITINPAWVDEKLAQVQPPHNTPQP